MPPALLLSALASTAVHAQSPQQSALDARGDAAARIVELTWVLVLGGGAIFLVVMALLVLALRGPAGWRDRLARRSWILGAGVAFPVVALSMLLIYSFGALASIAPSRQAAAATRIQVTGELWWWRVRYLDAAGAILVETANEIHIPVGQPVELELRSNDVIHSFWVPNLAGKMDMIPGRVNRLRLQAREPGSFRGQCAEFCGAQHARMALYVVAAPEQEHAAWLAAQRQPASGQGAVHALFEQGRCGACHAIRGTGAAGTFGPDLTHVGSRMTLGAATIANAPGALAQWIAHVQQLKPGSRMPAYRQYTEAELQELAAYLAGLR